MESGQDGKKKPARSGSVRHDASGLAIWEWAVESGRHAIDSTSRLLQKLDLTSMRLLGDDEKPLEERVDARALKSIPSFGGPREADPMAAKRHEFNPYDTRIPTGRGVSIAPKPDTPARPRVTQPVRPRKAGLFARLFTPAGR
jgi:hypothetical protein